LSVILIVVKYYDLWTPWATWLLHMLRLRTKSRSVRRARLSLSLLLLLVPLLCGSREQQLQD
jgi:hypothetical protein